MSYSPKVFDFFGKNKRAYFNYLSSSDKVTAVSHHLADSLNRRTFPEGKLEILCLGGGSGETDLAVIESLKHKNIEINYVDPSSEIKQYFLKNVHKKDLTKKLGRIDLAKFESLPYLPPKADLILCLSSVYFLEGWRILNKQNPLLKIFNSLKDEGIAAIVLKSDQSDHCLAKKIGGGGQTCGRDVRVVLRKLKIPHYWETISSFLDLSECFKNGGFQPTKQGLELLSFMFKGEWTDFSPETKAKVVKALEDKVTTVKDRSVLKTSYECIWLSKPSVIGNRRRDSFRDTKTDGSTFKLASQLEKKIRNFADFPKKGINFKDTTPILKDPELFKRIIDYVREKYGKQKIDFVVAKDMQGLIWAGALAPTLKAGIIPMFRKDLAGEVLKTIYAHEYNPNRVLNLQKEAFSPGQRILIVDYLIATGETMKNMIRLIEHLGGNVVGIFSLIELTSLKGRKGLEDYNLHTIVKY